MTQNKKVLIITPTYNEIGNIPKLVERLEALDLGLHMLIVDDNSPDGTGEWVKEYSKDKDHIHLIQREGKLGLGSAYVRGFQFAMEHQYDYVFEMDADFSHNPKYIPRFLRAMEHADVVIGSRYLGGIHVVNWPLRRLLLSYFANVYARLVTGLPIRDVTAVYKCFRIEAIKAIDWDTIHSDGYSFQVEVNDKLWKKKFFLKEIPIVFKDRTEGVSKMSGKIIREAMFLLLKIRFGKTS
jgi:dolichol-phosphate mannosyltransferase